MLSPSQLVAARGLVSWTVVDLAAASGTSRHAVMAFENGRSNPTLTTLQAWIGALHRVGVALIDETDTDGPGVRLRKGAAVPAPVSPPPGKPVKGRRKAKGKALP